MTGKELQASRKSMGLTQGQLAHELGVCKDTLARWEREERNPPGHLLDMAMQVVMAKTRKGNHGNV